MNSADLNAARVMQLATEHGGQPWVCSVYFVVYQRAFYWLSLPTRRHSENAAANPRAAVAIAIKIDVPVIGVQAEGDVSIVQDIAEVTAVMEKYAAKYNQGTTFAERLAGGANSHALYKLTPRKVMLFDEFHTSDQPYKEITITP